MRSARPCATAAAPALRSAPGRAFSAKRAKPTKLTRPSAPNAARAWKSANPKPCWFLRSDLVPKLRINGISVEVEPGTTVLESIRFLGLPIPTLCHDDGLRDIG